MTVEYPEQAPSFVSRRVGGIPVWLLAVAGGIALYLLFFRGRSGTSATAPQDGTVPGTDLSGSTNTFNPGDVSLTVNPPGTTDGTPNPQPKPIPHPKKKTTSVNVLRYTVKPGDTLASIAQKYGISVATLAHSNVYVKGETPGDKKVGQRLGTGAGLKTGQVLNVPIAK